MTAKSGLMEDFINSCIFIHDDSGENVRYDQYSLNALIIGAPLAVVDSLEGFGKQYLEELQRLGVYPEKVIVPKRKHESVLENLLEDDAGIEELRDFALSKEVKNISTFSQNKRFHELVDRLGIEGMKLCPKNNQWIRYNDKIEMRKMAENLGIPITEGVIASSVEEIKKFWRNHPDIIIKHPKMAGGRGNYIVLKSEKPDISLPKVSFPVVVEDYKKCFCSPVSHWIRWNGMSQNLFQLKQIIDGATHHGNVYPISSPEETSELSDAIHLLEKYSRMMTDSLEDYEGVIGYDFIITQNKTGKDPHKVFLVDLNARFNSSTYPMQCLVKTGMDFKEKHISYHHVFKECKNLSQYLKKPGFKPLTIDGGILLFNPFLDFSRNLVTSFSSLCAGNSADEIERYEKIVDSL